MQNVESFESLEQYPHHPQMANRYYCHPALAGGNGVYLNWLLDRFRPATPEDRELIKALFLTFGWGGAGGTRPLWVITVPEQYLRRARGQGAGKTTLANMATSLFGGSVQISKKFEWSEIGTRLLSPTGRQARSCILDNIKSHSLSCSDLEAAITLPYISGRELWKGEGKRPNTFVWLFTLNDAKLSRDLAQRSIIIHLKPVEYSENWSRDTWDFIERHRWEIIGDIIAELQRNPTERLTRHSRWGDWEDGVLTRCDSPDDVQKVYLSRQKDLDAAKEDAGLIRQTLAKKLQARERDYKTSVIKFTSDDLVSIVNQAVSDGSPQSRISKKTLKTYFNSVAVPEITYKKSHGIVYWLLNGKELEPGEKPEHWSKLRVVEPVDDDEEEEDDLCSQEE